MLEMIFTLKAIFFAPYGDAQNHRHEMNFTDVTLIISHRMARLAAIFELDNCCFKFLKIDGDTLFKQEYKLA